MSTMSEDKGAAALLSPASSGSSQLTMAERPALAEYKYSEKNQAANGSGPHKAADVEAISVAEFLQRLLSSRLLTSEEVDQFLANQLGLPEGDTPSLAEAFVGQGLL